METQDLRKAGLKVTIPRKKILEVLEKSEEKHVSAENVYRMLLGDGEDIGLTTVYRVLTQFEAAGLVVRHCFGNEAAVFELVQGEHHDHIVCTKCGKIIEEFHDPVLENRIKKIAGGHGLGSAEYTLIVYAECRDTECKNLGL